MHINSNIKYLRKRKGLTQHDLAKELDKTYITVGDYERGKIIPPLPVALELCRIFDINLDTLVQVDLRQQGLVQEPKIDYATQYRDLKKQFDTLEQLSKLQAQRLNDLERMIRKYAPELGREMGLE